MRASRPYFRSTVLLQLFRFESWWRRGPMECSPPDSSVHGILQARTLGWDALPSSRVSSPPRDRTHISYMFCISRWILYHLEQTSKHGLHSFRFHIRNFPTKSCEVLELYSHLHSEKINLFYGRQILLFEWRGLYKSELLQRMWTIYITGKLVQFKI